MNRKNLILILAGFLLVFLVLTGFIYSLSSEDEINQLEQELIDLGYDWLVNYSIDAPNIEVYVRDSDELIISFENISGENWYKVYLTELNGSFDVFDLKVIGAVEFDYIIDPSYSDITVYENVSDVYHDFIWDQNNVWLQVRSCDDTECSGESFVGAGNTSSTWLKDFYWNSLNSTLTPNNQYFQYKAFLWRNVSGRVNEIFTPELYNVTLSYYNASEPTIEKPSLDTSTGEFNCSTTGNSLNENITIYFYWYRNSILYASDNINTTSGNLTSDIISPYTDDGDVWYCKVQSYDADYSENKSSDSSTVDLIYSSVNSVYHFFKTVEGNYIKMQVRSCDDTECSGESFVGADNTSNNWFENPNNGNLTNLTDNRYLQYQAYFWINETLKVDYSAELYNVSYEINDIAPPEINITSPINNTIQTDKNLDIEYVYVEVNPDTCWYTNDTNSVNTTLASCGTNITSLVWPNGQHNVTIWINDTSNHVNWTYVNFTEAEVGVECNTTDVIMSIWAYSGGKFIDGFSNEFCTNAPINTTLGEAIWSYSNGRFVDGISTSTSTLPYNLGINNCNMTDIAIAMWCYTGVREINGIQSGIHPYQPINATYGQYVWEWTKTWKYVNGVSALSWILIN